jgi:hypothetical protein
MLSRPFITEQSLMKVFLLVLIFCAVAVSTGWILKKPSVENAGGGQDNSSTVAASGQSEVSIENVSAAQRGVTGTYDYKGENRTNQIKVLDLGSGNLRVEFMGSYEFKTQSGELMANTGGTDGAKARLVGNSAELKLKDFPKCKIRLTFSGDQLVVKQSSTDADCGFGANVFADGTYHKTSSARPKFGEWTEAPEAKLENQSSVGLQDSAPKRVKFPAGSSSAVVNDKIVDGRGVRYLVGARAGQTMKIDVTEGGPNNDAVFSIVGPDGRALIGDGGYESTWTGKLSGTGDYTIYVSAIETRNVSFKLTISIR